MYNFRKKLLKFFTKLVLGFVLLSLLLVLPFRWLNPPVSMVMLDRWLAADSDWKLKQEWLEWGQLPKSAVMAVVTSEDQLFPQHSGFDFNAIWTAVTAARDAKRLRGASTISQQVARNMYLWTDRSWFRKGLEVWFTLLIELCWDKKRILTVYLNIAEWGQGVFGLEAASQYHFNKPAKKLTDMQSALLASSLPSPLRYRPARPAQHLINRANWNLQQQQKLGGSVWLSGIE